MDVFLREWTVKQIDTCSLSGYSYKKNPFCEVKRLKKTIPRSLFCMFALAVCLALCLFFGRVLFTYTVPMEDATYDLSLGWEGEAMPESWEYDQKGWSIFIQEGEQGAALTADGMGGFTGLQEAGQTFYYSRALSEILDSPTLRLGTANRSVAVFLDGELLYTDCPEQDNRIGYLRLPMLGWDRTEPIVLSLPLDYVGKTLTIAQSTGLVEKQEPEAAPTVWPCSIQLYCGYSYESGLISESFQTAIPAALCFGVGVLLLTAFLWQLFSGTADWSLPFLSLTAFLWSTWQIAMSSFTYAYFGVLPVDIASLSRLLSLTVLLLFLASRVSGKRRMVCGVLTSLQGAAVLISAVPNVNQQVGFLWASIPEWLGLVGLICSLGCMVWEWKKHRSFSRFFCPLAALGLAVFLVWVLAVPSLRQEVGQQLSLGAQGYFLWKLMALTMPAAILSALLELVAGEIARRTESRLLAQRYELAQSGFENLCRHQEEVMMLRHDMAKHLTFLRQSTSDKATAAYLDELIGQQQDVSPVVQSRNRTMDILLNAKLGEAAEKGIAVEILQADAPESLPLTDAELCALMMNLLDNAIRAASLSEKPFLRLDLHQKDGFFVFVCENAATADAVEKRAKKETVPQHGLGLKIIEQIVKRHGDLMEAERLPGSYRVTIAILLDQPRR